MSFFSKFKIGSTSYDVKDAAAGKSLSISGNSLSLKNAAGTAVSTVDLPAATPIGITYSTTYGWHVIGDTSKLITSLPIGSIIYFDNSNVDPVILKNGSTYNTSLKLTSNLKIPGSNGLGNEYISIYSSFTAIITAVNSSLVTARIISASDSLSNAPYNAAYNATNVDKHPYTLGSIVFTKSLTSNYIPFVVKNGTTAINPTSATLYVYDNRTYLILLKFTLESSVYADIYTVNNNAFYSKLIPYMSSTMYASSTYAASSNNHNTYLNNNVVEINTKLTIGNNNTLNMAAGDAALFIYGAFPNTVIDDNIYYHP